MTIFEALDRIEAACPSRRHEVRGLRIALRDGLSTVHRRLQDVARHCLDGGGADWSAEELRELRAALADASRAMGLGSATGFCSVAEVAEAVGIQPASVRHAIMQGRVPAIRPGGRDLLVPAEYADPERWARTRGVPGRPRTD